MHMHHGMILEMLREPRALKWGAGVSLRTEQAMAILGLGMGTSSLDSLLLIDT
jgi:hypothetical protein